jgi:predicted negative regulator of RcsB-dependent stress response
MTRTGEAARPSAEERTDTLMDWAQAHARELALGGLVLGALLIGGYLYRSSADTKNTNAEVALAAATQAAANGNPAVAQTELEKLIQRFSGTPSATQASIVLAQTLYQQGKFQEGVAKLEAIAAKESDGVFGTAIYRLIAAGHSQMQQPAEAAAAFERAAAASNFAAEKDALRSQAARAQLDAGNREAAIKIWEELANSETAAVATEARLRLGQVQSKPASRG